MWPGHPSSLSGDWTVTDALDEISQGNIVQNRRGQPVGVYIDDSTPNIETWVHAALAERHRIGKIFVSIPMGRPRFRWPAPVINLLEWYPFRTGWGEPVGPIPACEGYILQCAYPGMILAQSPHLKLEPPTEEQFHQLVREALAHHPRFIWKF